MRLRMKQQTIQAKISTARAGAIQAKISTARAGHFAMLHESCISPQVLHYGESSDTPGHGSSVDLSWFK